MGILFSYGYQLYFVLRSKGDHEMIRFQYKSEYRIHNMDEKAKKSLTKILSGV